MSRYLFSLLLLIPLSSLGADDHACGVSLNRHVPAFDQGNSVMCGGFATAQFLSSFYRTPISPMWVTLQSGNIGSRTPAESMEAISGQNHLCTANTDLEPSAEKVKDFVVKMEAELRDVRLQVSRLSSISVESRAHDLLVQRAQSNGFESVRAYIQNVKSNQLQTLKEKIQDEYKTLFSFGGKFSANEEDLNQFFKDLETTLSNTESNEQQKAAELALLGYENYCKANRVTSKVQNSGFEHIQDNQQLSNCGGLTTRIDGELNQGRPALISTQFATIYNQDSEPSRASDHYVAVIGKDCSGPEPRYLIRNSYGASCGNHNPAQTQAIAWDCNAEKGEFWLPKSKLCSNAGDLFTFTSNPEPTRSLRSLVDEN